MDPAFREMFEAMKQTAEGLILANQGIIQANEGIKRMADAALQANEEQEDLGETLRRLETFVMEQGADIRALRDDVRRLRDDRH